jgi:hypothetical protein
MNVPIKVSIHTYLHRNEYELVISLRKHVARKKAWSDLGLTSMGSIGRVDIFILLGKAMAIKESQHSGISMSIK